MTLEVPKNPRNKSEGRLAAKKEAFAQAYAAQPKDSRNASAAYRASRDCAKMQTSTINSNAKKLLRETPVRLRIEAIERERECSPKVLVAESAPVDTGLKLEEERFCQHFVLNDNAAAAYLEAFPKSRKWKAKSRHERASRLLAEVKVQSRIAALRTKVAAVAEKSFEVTADRVLAEYARIGFSNMLDYITVQPDGTAFCDLSKLTRDQAAAIQEANFETVLSTNPDAVEAAGEEDDGTERKKVAVIKGRIKLADKRAALGDLGKHLGLFGKDNAQAGEAAGKAMAEATAHSDRDLARAILDIFRGANIGGAPQAKPEGKPSDRSSEGKRAAGG